jgi:hypothetical protein
MYEHNMAANKIQKWWLFVKGVNHILTHNKVHGDCQPIMICINRATRSRHTELYAMITVDIDARKLDIGHSDFHLLISFKSKILLLRYLYKYAVKASYLTLVYSKTNMMLGGGDWFGGSMGGERANGVVEASASSSPFANEFANQWKWFVWGCS